MSNPPSTYDPYYSVEEYYQNNADIIAENFPTGYQVATIGDPDNTYRFLCEAVGLQENDFIMDFGCGNGQFLEYICKTYEYVSGSAIDLSFNQAYNAINNIQKYNREGISRFSLFCKNMDMFTSAEEYYDKYFLIETVGYSADINGLVRAVSCGLKEGGKVLIKNPFKIVTDEEADKAVMEYFKDISAEYGYNENSLGMIPDLNVVKNAFLNYGFELEKEILSFYETDTYNAIFENSPLAETHPCYINHIKFPPELNYSTNTYSECIILVFKKVEKKITDDNLVTSLPAALKREYENAPR